MEEGERDRMNVRVAHPLPAEASGVGGQDMIRAEGRGMPAVPGLNLRGGRQADGHEFQRLTHVAEAVAGNVRDAFQMAHGQSEARFFDADGVAHHWPPVPAGSS